MQNRGEGHHRIYIKYGCIILNIHNATTNGGPVFAGLTGITTVK